MFQSDLLRIPRHTTVYLSAEHVLPHQSEGQQNLCETLFITFSFTFSTSRYDDLM